MTTTETPSSTTYAVRHDEGSVIAPFVVLDPTGCRVGSWLTEDAALRDAEQRSRVAAQNTPIPDTTAPGCPEKLDGLHDITWTRVPAQTWAGQPDRGYGEHQRGFCWACDEHFIR